MTQHPTEPGLIAPGGGETAETDILDEAVDAPRADRIALSGAMLISAVRYALGRKTYIVSETVREVQRVWEDLPARWQVVIARDIKAELELWQRIPDFAPHQCDVDEWRKLLDRFEEVDRG